MKRTLRMKASTLLGFALCSLFVAVSKAKVTIVSERGLLFFVFLCVNFVTVCLVFQLLKYILFTSLIAFHYQSYRWLFQPMNVAGPGRVVAMETATSS